MPTLVEFDAASLERESSAGATARPSAVMWMEREFRPSPRSDNHKLQDDSTLSGSMLIAALEDMRKINEMTKNDSLSLQQTEPEFQTSTIQSHDANSQSARLIDSAFDDDSTLSAFQDSKKIADEQHDTMHDSLGSPTMNESYFAEAISQQPKLSIADNPSQQDELFSVQVEPRKERSKGPMEEEYISNYQGSVKDKIRAFRNHHPEKLPDYNNMSIQEKQNERKHVLKLLQRLRIASASNDGDMMDGVECDKDVVHSAGRIHRSLGSQHQYLDSQRDDAQDEGKQNNAQSIALLSPGARSGSTLASLEKSVALLTPHAHKPSPSGPSSTSPIEVARLVKHYDSPEDEPDQLRKRMASLSGKRGADTSRARTDRSPFGNCDGELLDNKDEPCEMKETPKGNKIFSASQSPISPDGSNLSTGGVMSPNTYSDRDISFGEDEENDSEESESGSMPNDTIVHTLTQDRKVQWKLNMGPVRESALSVYLKTGKTAHFRPLDVEYNSSTRRAPPTQSFPDPLEGYEDRTRRRLSRLCKWIRRRDRCEQESGLILSLEHPQVIDVSLRLLLDSSGRMYERDRPDIAGNTLIVSRSRDDLEEWGRALREFTAFSVLNHSTLPLKERKAQVTVAKCAQCDVVLTTYDAIKAPDATVALNDNGIATVKNDEPESGWYCSRSQMETVECKKMSVLHQLQWRRVLFVDVLGKKCYLAKPGTSRATAARAICSCSRFIFVVGSPQDGVSLTALENSDKDSLLSIGTVLHKKSTGENSLLESFVDFKDSSTIR